MAVDAVLFDLDNTLYEYAPCNRAGKDAAHRAARDRGYDMDREAFEALYRVGRRETKRDTETTAAAHRRLLYFKHGLRERFDAAPAGDVLALAEAFWTGYIDRLTPFEGLDAMLSALAAADVAVAITTNLTTRTQYRKLRELGIAEPLDAFVTSEEAGREKPATVMFTLPLSRLDCPPSRAAFVGDEPETDIGGANAVGLETVLFNGEVSTDAPAAHRPDHRVESLSAVPEVLL